MHDPRLSLSRSHVKRSLLLLAPALVACGGGAPATASMGPAREPSVVRAPHVAPMSDTVLAGSYRWVSFDGKVPPIEYPPGAGASLLQGSLDLVAGETSAAGRYTTRFVVQRSEPDTARIAGESGDYRVKGDSLLLLSDGPGARVPVRFRFIRYPDGILALTDVLGHSWGYVRR